MRSAISSLRLRHGRASSLCSLASSSRLETVVASSSGDHPVELAGQIGQLVTPGRLDAVGQIAARDRFRAPGQRLDRLGDDANEQEAYGDRGEYECRNQDADALSDAEDGRLGSLRRRSKVLLGGGLDLLVQHVIHLRGQHPELPVRVPARRRRSSASA